MFLQFIKFVLQTSKSAVQKRKQVLVKTEQASNVGTTVNTPSPVSSTTSGRGKSAVSSAQGVGKRITRNTGEVKSTKRTRKISGQSGEL